MPGRRSVSRSSVDTDTRSSNTSMEGFKRGYCCHGRRQKALLDEGLSLRWKNKRIAMTVPSGSIYLYEFIPFTIFCKA